MFYPDRKKTIHTFVGSPISTTSLAGAKRVSLASAGVPTYDIYILQRVCVCACVRIFGHHGLYLSAVAQALALVEVHN